MYLKSLDDLPKNEHFLVLVTGENPLETCPSFPSAIPILPSDKNTHDIDTVRRLETLTRTKQTSPQTIVIAAADRLTIPAQNAFLKLLEEPGDNTSFIFLVASPDPLLPTVLSRAKLFFLKNPPPPPDQATLKQARTLVSGRPHDLIALGQTLSKDRERALAVVKTAIEELHRAQLIKPAPAFLKKLEQLLALEKALKNNGHIKLHITNMI